MPFVKELPTRTRKGSSKYGETLVRLTKKPNTWYEFDEEFENASGTAAMLKNSKFTEELGEENNGSFEFKAIAGTLFARFNATVTKRTSKSKK